jgi:hypothetical protein
MTAGSATFLEHGHALEQVEELEDQPDVAAAQPGQVVLAAPGDLLARHADVPLVGGVQPGDQVQQGGLAAPRRPHQGHELASLTVRSTPRRRRTGAFSASKVLRTPRTVSAACSQT